MSRRRPMVPTDEVAAECHRVWSTELPCARGRGLVWRGAGGRVPYCLRVIPRVYPGSKWRIFRRASCMQTPDGLPMARSTLLGIAGGERASISPPAPLVFVGLTDLLAYRVPYIRPARLVYLVGRVRRGAGLPLPGARHLRSTLYTRRPFRLPSLRAPTVPGANVIGPGALHARPPEVAQESTHRLFTGSRRARGCCASRPAAAWGGFAAVAPPGAERHRLGCRLGRSTVPLILLRRHTSPTHTPFPICVPRVPFCSGF